MPILTAAVACDEPWWKATKDLTGFELGPAKRQTAASSHPPPPVSARVARNDFTTWLYATVLRPLASAAFADMVLLPDSLLLLLLLLLLVLAPQRRAMSPRATQLRPKL